MDQHEYLEHLDPGHFLKVPLSKNTPTRVVGHAWILTISISKIVP